MNSLMDNEVWELVPLPEHRKLVGSKWVFKIKPDEKVERYKAAQGFTRSRLRRDLSLEWRTIVALAAQHGHQVDITTAFLNGQLRFI